MIRKEAYKWRLGRNGVMEENERLRNALWEVTTNGRWTEGEQRGEWAISKEVYDTAKEVADALHHGSGE